MKTKAFFEKLKRQGKIENEDFNKFIESFPEDNEIPDIAANLIEHNFLTRDRAIVDEAILSKAKADVLDGVDSRYKKLIPLLDPKDREEIEKEKNTFKKIEFLETAIPRLVEKAKSVNPDVSEEVKGLKREREELVGKLQNQKTEYETKLTEKDKLFQAKEAGLKLDWTLDRELGKFTFADEWKDKKETITEIITTKLKKENVLAFGENGQIQVQEIVDGAAKQKFNGNDPVTIEKLLETAVSPFLKRNNADVEKNIKPTPGRKTVSDDVDLSKLTLPERRRLAAQSTG